MEDALPQEVDARLRRLADDFEQALQNFIVVIRKNRSYQEDGARKACIAIFSFLGNDHELTRKYRSEMSSALYA